MIKTLKDKVAVITGAASGIGRAIADRCARKGVRMVLTDKDNPSAGRAWRNLVGLGQRDNDHD
jgi:NAD(P)-dependent dehydrogenase (short-subunit alcohol dehydrogenase family)